MHQIQYLDYNNNWNCIIILLYQIMLVYLHRQSCLFINAQVSLNSITDCNLCTKASLCTRIFFLNFWTIHRFIGSTACRSMKLTVFEKLWVFSPYLFKCRTSVILNVSDPNPKISTAINMSSSICRSACFGVILYSPSLMKIWSIVKGMDVTVMHTNIAHHTVQLTIFDNWMMTN